MNIRGIVPAIITPMHEDESLNLGELKRQVDRWIAAGNLRVQPPRSAYFWRG